jgi:nitroreductase
MNLYNLIIKRRSVRLFKQKEVSESIIRKVINAARVAPSAANLQFLEYLVVTDSNLRDKIFPNTRWAGYVRPRRTPTPGKTPTLYIVILINKEKTKKPDLRDVGAAAQNILLSLVSFGLGACWLASIDRRAIRKILDIPSKYKIDSVIAAGFAAESPRLETDSRNIKYWLDKKGRFHVPKRRLADIIHYNKIR